MASARDMTLAYRAKRAGSKNYTLRIIWEARRAGIPISAGFALVEKESGFRNVFGHDPTASIPADWKGTTVTERKYDYYLRKRARYGMQGVGPTQLTWWEYQDRADRLGGCHVPKHNIRVGFEVFASHFKKYRSRGYNVRTSLRLAGRDYNGTGRAAEAYGWDFVRKYDRWHRALDG